MISTKAALLLGALLFVSGCAQASSEPEPSLSSNGSIGSNDAVQPQVGTSATPSEATDVPSDSGDNAADPVMFKMPLVVGMNLQDAQDLLQSLGSYFMVQEDASGRGRSQLLDRNWTVCTQDPAAGATTETSDLVTLGSVKLAENCP